VVSDDGGTEATMSQMDADSDMRAADTGPDTDMGVVEAGPDDRRVVDARPDMDAAENEADSTGPNLITNGNFARGTVDWDLMGTGGLSTPPVTPPQLCVTVPSGQSVILGWTPGGIMLSPGATYTFSYWAMATPAVTVESKVGHSIAPFTPEYTGADAVPTTLSFFSHPVPAPVAADAAETSAGVEFTIPDMGTVASDETVCFENVSLVENY
jgi:hypothetical protein